MESIAEVARDSQRPSTLTHQIIGGIRGRFVVPGYQRGYRWDPNDVTRLLDDISDSNGDDCNLQPIVVKLSKRGGTETENEWELIDGQQRLTTLYLLLQYMERHAKTGLGAPYQLRYDTRPGTEKYLKTLDESLHNANADYYHIYQAHQCIAQWFEKHGDKYAQNSAANTIHGYLFKSVRVIWYDAAGEKGIELFTRLNVGRIPLTDSELIKAALLSAVRKDSRIGARAYEIAAQWDSIERDLQDAGIWAFVSGLPTREGNERYPTRISLLLDTLADEIEAPLGKRPRYYTFDILRDFLQQKPVACWKAVVGLHAQLLGWAEEPHLFNKIGFLVSTGDAFTEIVRAARGKKKSEFEIFLLERIRHRLNVKYADLDDLNYEDKRRGYHKLLELLLLVNVETKSQFNEYFPFFHHVGKEWSLEHIHAQNADNLNKAEQWNIWLSTHITALEAIVDPLNDGAIVQLRREARAAISDIALATGRFSGERFNDLSTRVLNILNRDDAPDHSIRNLALLSSADNSRLSNSVFEVKRQMILELDRRGEYVPVCTRNVFLKYYADADAQQPHFWSEADKISYFRALRNQLAPYLIGFPQEESAEQ
jgi:hypothetical protein